LQLAPQQKWLRLGRHLTNRWSDFTYSANCFVGASRIGASQQIWLTNSAITPGPARHSAAWVIARLQASASNTNQMEHEDVI
jgi:hypothetical protein